MAKGYNKRNLLLRIIEVQEEYMKYANSGRTNTYIFREFIYPKYRIGINTFYRYLSTPAKRNLEKLEKKGEITKDQQLRLFND